IMLAMAPSPSGQRNRLVATTIFLLHIVAFASANCFLPNGTDRNTILWDSHGIDYQPSGYGSPADDFQMCCATNNRETPDLPRKDGLCNDPIGIWRESCTDPTWKSPSCVKLCIDGTNKAKTEETTTSGLHNVPTSPTAAATRTPLAVLEAMVSGSRKANPQPSTRIQPNPQHPPQHPPTQLPLSSPSLHPFHLQHQNTLASAQL
ncbi:MAG: hypothetical protein Q9180_003707, partial [Flavoplaca navasiana]